MVKFIKFIISSNPDNLAAALYGNSGTVEAEYGDIVIEGSVATLAHHGPRSGNPPPCVFKNQDISLDVIGLSHLDLDSLGGCMSLLGVKPVADSFWELAGWVDINGPHKLGTFDASEGDLASLYAYWAWSETHRVYPPRDGSVLNVTEEVLEAMAAIEAILAGDEELLAQGVAWKAQEDALNQDSFVECIGGVTLRSHVSFVNHLYVTPGGRPQAAVVALKTTTGEVTISLADPIQGVSCKDIAKSLWGPDAGGHDGIAGSPRTGGLTLEDARLAAIEMAAKIAG